MLIQHQREKLINAIIYFARNTHACGKTKLFKLLYFLDFEHYSQIGRSVTGLNYYAWKYGPVPTALHEEFDAPEPDMAAHVKFKEVIRCYPSTIVEPLADLDLTHFSKRELRIMEELANKYKDTSASDMVEATHLPKMPWHRVYIEEKKQQAFIPYEYALNDSSMDDLIKERIIEYKEMRENYT